MQLRKYLLYLLVFLYFKYEMANEGPKERILLDFAYRTSLNFITFLAAGAAALIIALLTTSYQAIKAALSDPVQSLKYE
jgi:ABC-type lipoprotein release transport system permease subunit